MSSINPPTSPVREDDRRVKSRRNPVVTLQILEIVLLEYLLPEYTWDEVEECLGWCSIKKLDPVPFRRIGREWMHRASMMRTLLKALFVRTRPEKFSCGITGTGVPHAIASLLGRMLRESPRWWTEVQCQYPYQWLRDGLAVLIYLWWLEHEETGWTSNSILAKGPPAWYTEENPGVKEEYFQLWKILNMFYERLSLPWKRLKTAGPIMRAILGDTKLPSIREAVNELYRDVKIRWEDRKITIWDLDRRPMPEQIQRHHEDGQRTPRMKLDYSPAETRLEEVGSIYLNPKEENPRRMYRHHCTVRELSILDRNCGVDGIPYM